MAVLHFEILRRIAETASGLRYQDTWFEVTDTDVLIYDKEPTTVLPGSILIKCTGWKEPTIPKVATATIATDTSSIDLLAVPVPEQELPGWTGPMQYTADAVFWSASAVEKFLVPYYASVYGTLAPDVVAQLTNVFVPAGSAELAANTMMEMVGAPPPPTSPPLDVVTPELTISPPPDYDQPFAIVHLPSSEYVADAGLDDGSGGGGAGYRGDPLPRLFTLHQSGAVKKLRIASALPAGL